ncbi:MAG: efflux RND transporter periplasmic adaptor subunit [Pirellula sp.]|nr:efflux RND transporter periplasmic adaptor subunit [Pirellula sp.]
MKIRWRLVGVGLFFVACVGLVFASVQRSKQIENAESASRFVSVKPSQISALGTIAPRGRIRHLAAPSSFSRVGRLLVEERDQVAAGQVIAYADDRELRATELEQAKVQVAIAESKLAKLLAGPDPHEVSALSAALSSAIESCEQRKRELARASELIKSKSISQEEFEDSKLRVTLATLAIHELEAKQKLLLSVREEDVQVMRSELDAAVGSVATAKENLAMTEVVSPIDGLVLRVHVRDGERPGESGIIDLGDTRRMQVIAEVYEADAIRLRVGSLAQVVLKSSGLELNGVVSHVRPLVGRKTVLDNDPVSDADARVVETIIDLDDQDCALVESLSNASVIVTIRTDES